MLDAAARAAILDAVATALDKMDSPKSKRWYVILRREDSKTARERVFLLDVPADVREDIAEYAVKRKFEPLYEMITSGAWRVVISGDVKAGEFVEIGR